MRPRFLLTLQPRADFQSARFMDDRVCAVVEFFIVIEEIIRVGRRLVGMT